VLIHRLLTRLSQRREAQDRRSAFEASGRRWTLLAVSWLIAMSVGAYLARANAIAVTGIFANIPPTILASGQVMKIRNQIATGERAQTTESQEDQAVIS
jgi:hypothetical protein